MNDGNLSSSDLQTYRLRRSGKKRVILADEPIYKQHRSPWWSTEDEKNYLDGIGTFSLKSDRIDLEKRRLEFLLNYRKSIFNRKVWEDRGIKIDPGEILLYVDLKIMECSK